MTTIVPFIITFVINLFVIARKMSLSPLQFIRRDLSRRHKKKAMKLPRFSFFGRFRLRILFQNLSNYGMLFVGICFANVLLLFGLMMGPLLQHYQDSVLEHQIAKYQYVLLSPIPTKSDAEQYSAMTLRTAFEDADSEDVTIYGVAKDSSYVDISPKTGEIYISDGFDEKFAIKVGDTVTLKEEYGRKEYSFTVTDIYEYPASLSVFMNQQDFSEKFDLSHDYFNGYFSNEEITDIDKAYIGATITKDDLTKITRQLNVSMGSLFHMIKAFAVILFMMLVFLLTKLVVEKNANAISMVKILGYENREIKKLYLTTSRLAVIISLVLSLPVSVCTIKAIYREMMGNAFSGWLTFYIQPVIYVQILLIGFITYMLVEVLLYQKIKKVPMDEALKNVE